MLSATRSRWCGFGHGGVCVTQCLILCSRTQMFSETREQTSRQAKQLDKMFAVRNAVEDATSSFIHSLDDKGQGGWQDNLWKHNTRHDTDQVS